MTDFRERDRLIARLDEESFLRSVMYGITVIETLEGKWEAQYTSELLRHQNHPGRGDMRWSEKAIEEAFNFRDQVMTRIQAYAKGRFHDHRFGPWLEVSEIAWDEPQIAMLQAQGHIKARFCSVYLCPSYETGN